MLIERCACAIQTLRGLGDLSPRTSAKTLGRFRQLTGAGDEAVELHGRANHWDPAGA